MSVAVCHINDEMHQELKAFRFNKSKQARAMILKIDPASKGMYDYPFHQCFLTWGKLPIWGNM